MKTKILALIISILCLSVLLVACDEPCETHVDENKDGVCDKCEATVETETETETETEIICDEHKDEDADKTCDACGKAVVIVTEYVTQATETETEINCDVHVDTDADKVCDVCSKAVVVIVEKVTAEDETKVDMIVNEIPETSKVEDYVNVELPTYDALSNAAEIVGLDRDSITGHFACKVTGDEGSEKYTVFDLTTGTAIKSVTNITETDYKKSYSVSFSEYWFTITATEETYGFDYEGDPYLDSRKHTVDVYTYTGEQIGTSYVDEEGSLFTYTPAYEDEVGDDALVYVVYQETYYVIDTNTYGIIYTCAPEKMVYRPEFDVVVGDYGYVYTGGSPASGFNVYNMTKWIECVYSYTAPSRYNNASLAVLDNGNVLVWATVELPINAVSYDIVSGGTKYDMVYTILDPIKGTETAVEFGYRIASVTPISAEGFYTAAAADYNTALVYPVENGYVNTNAPMTLIVDNELNIICELNLDTAATLVSKNVFLQRISFNDGKSAYELVDVNGNHVGYVSINTDAEVGYTHMNGVFMDYSGVETFDANEYTVYADMREYGYLILYKDITEAVDDPETFEVDETLVVRKYFLYNPRTGLQPIDSDKDNWTIEHVTDYGYQVSYTELRDEMDVTVYKFYSVDNTFLFESEGELVYDTHYDDYYGYTYQVLRVVYEDADMVILATRNTEGGYSYIALK